METDKVVDASTKILALGKKISEGWMAEDQSEQFFLEESMRSRDEVIRRMANTSPKPRAPVTGKKPDQESGSLPPKRQP